MNQLPDVFIDSTKVTKSHIPAANIPTRIEIPTRKLQSSMTNEPKPRLKRGRPIGSKETIPRKRKSVISMTPEEHITVKHHVNEQVAFEEAPVPLVCNHSRRTRLCSYLITMKKTRSTEL